MKPDDKPCDCPSCTRARIEFSEKAEKHAPVLGGLFHPGSTLTPPAQNAPSVVRLQ